MGHSLWHIPLLAAKGERDWLEVLIPLAFAIIYAIAVALKKRSAKQQGGGTAEKQRSRPFVQLKLQKQSRQTYHETLSSSAMARETAQRQYDAAQESARRQFEGRMQRIHEYEQNRPMGVSDAIWKKQIDSARQTVRLEYEDAQQQARDEYMRVVGRWPEQPIPPARKAPKPQLAVQPPPKFPQPAAPGDAGPQAEALESLAYRLSFAKDDLVRGIVYSEILGKPLALREDA
jgi:hypothetical protein